MLKFFFSFFFLGSNLGHEEAPILIEENPASIYHLKKGRYLPCPTMPAFNSRPSLIRIPSASCQNNRATSSPSSSNSEDFQSSSHATLQHQQQLITSAFEEHYASAALRLQQQQHGNDFNQSLFLERNKVLNSPRHLGSSLEDSNPL